MRAADDPEALTPGQEKRAQVVATTIVFHRDDPLMTLARKIVLAEDANYAAAAQYGERWGGIGMPPKGSTKRKDGRFQDADGKIISPRKSTTAKKKPVKKSPVKRRRRRSR